MVWCFNLKLTDGWNTWGVGSVDCGYVWLKRINEMYGQEGLDRR